MAPTTTSSPSLASALPTSLPLPPVSPYGTFHGSLFQYNRNLVAFESSPSGIDPPSKLPPYKCILIGGLSDGLLPTPYTSLLEKACHCGGWSLVQPVLSSSYLGFGSGDLNRDTEEINALLHYLTSHRSAETFALIGHSTGCQNSVHFLRHGRPDLVARTKFVALQAPVSDREDAAANSPGYEENTLRATEMIQTGDGDEMMPRSAFWAPITASRFMDLQGKDGADDYFSSDLGDRELAERLKHVGKLEETGLRLLAAYSGRDEYVPTHIDTKLLVERFCTAMNQKCLERDVASPLYLTNANHNLSEGEGDAETFVDKVAEFLEVVKAIDNEVVKNDREREQYVNVKRRSRGDGDGCGVIGSCT